MLVRPKDITPVQMKTGPNTANVQGQRRRAAAPIGEGGQNHGGRTDYKTTPPLFRARCRNSAVFGNFWTRWGVVHYARAHTRPHRGNSPLICPPQRARAKNPLFSQETPVFGGKRTNTGNYTPERGKVSKTA